MTDPVIFKVPDENNPKEHVMVRFEYRTEKNEQASDTAGFPQFDELLIAYIAAPGMTRSEATRICDRKTPDGKVEQRKDAYARFGKYIEAFKQGETPTDMVGTPIEELAGVDMAMRETLKAMKIHTIEGLASLNDNAAFMGSVKLKMLANAFLEQRSGQAPLLKMAAQLEKAEEENKSLQRQIADLAARFGKIEDAQPAKRKAA